METHQMQNISIEQFVEARSIELTGFLNALADKQNSKRCPQNVPKTVRRRAMSHNRYRIPRRMRLGVEADLRVIESTQRIPRCRKNLRRKKRLLVSYKQRSGKVRWLPLHLWASKRMRMVEYFGYKIAECPNDKSGRACYRFARYAACLVDLSYYEIMMLTSEKVEELKTFFEKHFNSQEFWKWDEMKNSTSYFEGWLLNSNKTRICPARIYR
jgi:ribonuclease P/MRP protein subunit POP1